MARGRESTECRQFLAPEIKVDPFRVLQAMATQSFWGIIEFIPHIYGSVRQ